MNVYAYSAAVNLHAEASARRHVKKHVVKEPVARQLVTSKAHDMFVNCGGSSRHACATLRLPPYGATVRSAVNAMHSVTSGCEGTRYAHKDAKNTPTHTRKARKAGLNCESGTHIWRRSTYML